MDIKANFTYLATFVNFEISLFLTVIASIVIYFLLKGRINLRGLFFEKNKRRTYSWERVQVLILTFGFSAYYLILVRYESASGKLPKFPEEFLLLLGGSNIVYLWSKFFSLLKDRRMNRV